MKLITVIFFYNYYTQFYHTSCKFPLQWTPSIVQAILSYFKQLMSLWISDYNVSPPAWISSAGIWSLPGDLYSFNFYIPEDHNLNFYCHENLRSHTWNIQEIALWTAFHFSPLAFGSVNHFTQWTMNSPVGLMVCAFTHINRTWICILQVNIASLFWHSPFHSLHDPNHQCWY
jgi:hypothetical protein